MEVGSSPLPLQVPSQQQPAQANENTGTPEQEETDTGNETAAESDSGSGTPAATTGQSGSTETATSGAASVQADSSASRSASEAAPPLASVATPTQSGEVVRSSIEAATVDLAAEEASARALAEVARESALQSRIIEDLTAAAERTTEAGEASGDTGQPPPSAPPGQFTAQVEIVRGIGIATVQAPAVDVRS